MLNYIAWRTTGKNPCDDSAYSCVPVFITIAPREKETGVFPWVLPLARAVEMFGDEKVAQIGAEPVEVTMALSIPSQVKG